MVTWQQILMFAPSLVLVTVLITVVVRKVITAHHANIPSAMGSTIHLLYVQVKAFAHLSTIALAITGIEAWNVQSSHVVVNLCHHL